MSTFTLYNTAGKEVGTIERPALFSTALDEKLIHRYIVWVQSQLRSTLAHTLTRGDVRGGGKKPWKQKGTGRARVGSSRSPLWRKGGIVFGPRSEQTWGLRMPRAERRKALFSALSSKVDTVIVLEDWVMETPKTKEVITMLEALKVPTTEKVLHIHADFNDILFRSTANLQSVSSRTIKDINIVDVMNNDRLLLTKASLEALEKHFTSAV